MNVDERQVEPGPEGARLYERLLAAGELVAQDTAEEAELVRLGLAYFGGESDRLLRPVSPRHGLRVLMDRQHAELVDRQARLLESWRRFTGMLDAIPAGTGGGTVAGVEPVPELEQAATRAAELYGSARRLLRATFTADYRNRPTGRRTLLPPEGSGAEFRAVYDTEFARSDWGERIIRESVAAGEQVRVHGAVPTKMIHVDDRIALVAVSSDAAGALLVTAPDLLALLAGWFDLLWRDPATARWDEKGGDTLTDAQRRVLRLLALGCSDKQIAQRCGITPRTVSRHVAAILAELGVETRFAAGVAAARRGWL